MVEVLMLIVSIFVGLLLVAGAAGGLEILSSCWWTMFVTAAPIPAIRR